MSVDWSDVGAALVMARGNTRRRVTEAWCILVIVIDSAWRRWILDEDDAVLLLVMTYLLYLYSTKHKDCRNLEQIGIVLESCHLILLKHGLCEK